MKKGKYDSENWRAIPGYDGWYEISIDGEVRSWRANKSNNKRANEPYIMNPQRRKNGSCHVMLNRKNVKISHLMAITWMGGIPKGMYVKHKNKNVMDNSLYNLEFVTPKDFYKTSARGTRRPVFKIDKDGNILELYSSVTEAAKQNYLSVQRVIDRCKNRMKNPFSYADFTFMYESCQD